MSQFQLRSNQSFVALLTDACWTAAEVSPNKVDCLSSLLASDIDTCVLGKFSAYMDPDLADATAVRMTS